MSDKKTTLVFPGQGAQAMGMASDIVDAVPEAGELSIRADELLGIPLSNTIRNGPAEALVDTAVQQPALVLTSLLCLKALEVAAGEAGREAPSTTACAAAGLSLGEYAALTAAGALSFDDALRLVRRRGQLMKEAAGRTESGMAVVLNLDAEKVAEACRKAAEETGSVVAPANFNGGGQIAVAGALKALGRAMELCREQGARRVMKLPVSGAFHTELMTSAAEGMKEALAKATVKSCRFPVYANCSAAPVKEPAEIRDSLFKQITSPVLWEQTVRRLVAEGCTRFIELGPGRTLSNMIRRIAPEAECVPLSKWEDIRAFAAG